MDERQKEYRKEILKRKVKILFKYLFCIIYYSITTCVPIYIFYLVYCKKSHIIYAIAISFVFFTIMDIICSISEDVVNKIYCFVRKRKVRRQKKLEEIKRKKEEEIIEFEKFLLKKNNYEAEIEKAWENCSNFKEIIKANKSKLPQEIYQALRQVCSKRKQIIEVLKQDSEEYYSIRHTFTVYIPEFERMTNVFLEIVNADSLEESGKTEYMKLVTEFDKYLDFVKNQINISDKANLQISIKSLIKIMEGERKKGKTV